MDYEAMKRELSRRLKKSRYEHSLGVADTAAFLARRFGEDEMRARLAGLLHDCAREFPNEAMRAEADARGIAYGDVERVTPLLLHAQLSACRAREIYGVEDAAILRAIERHTVGGAAMTALDKIVYFADMVEPTRDYPAVEDLRRLAREASLDEMTLAGLTRSLAFVLEKGQLIHSDTVLARNELLIAQGGAGKGAE
ncbi:MAG: bis(5'-nucleosyl)-tetraphosphatase (symmetrical) YqeK [Selenomonadaceae bacterium]|nr:bis(5'-nucleosyl)-tetraphosphatase (symmetrical) YqeK [Selenomonadaceae bacterium]